MAALSLLARTRDATAFIAEVTESSTNKQHQEKDACHMRRWWVGGSGCVCVVVCVCV